MTWRCYNMYLTGDSSPPRVLFFLFFPCSSVGESTTRTQHRLSLGVELVGAISVLGVYESERCGAADKASGSGPLPHPTTTLAICAVTEMVPLTRDRRLSAVGKLIGQGNKVDCDLVRD